MVCVLTSNTFLVDFLTYLLTYLPRRKWIPLRPDFVPLLLPRPTQTQALCVSLYLGRSKLPLSWAPSRRKSYGTGPTTRDKFGGAVRPLGKRDLQYN